MKHLLIVVLALYLFVPAFATTTTLDPIADTGIFENAGTTNYGGDDRGFWGFWNGGAQRSLNSWDCTSLEGEAVSAAEITFTLKQNNFGSGQMQARKVEATWDEMTVTWNTQPAHDTTGAGLMLDQSWVTGLGPHTLALTAEALPIIQDWIDNSANNFGLILLKDPETGDVPRCYPWMKEHPSYPGIQLTLEHTTIIGIESASRGNIKAIFK